MSGEMAYAAGSRSSADKFAYRNLAASPNAERITFRGTAFGGRGLGRRSAGEADYRSRAGCRSRCRRAAAAAAALRDTVLGDRAAHAPGEGGTGRARRRRRDRGTRTRGLREVTELWIETPARMSAVRCG